MRANAARPTALALPLIYSTTQCTVSRVTQHSAQQYSSSQLTLARQQRACHHYFHKIYILNPGRSLTTETGPKQRAILLLTIYINLLTIYIKKTRFEQLELKTKL